MYGRSLVVSDVLVIMVTLAVYRAVITPPEPITLTWGDSPAVSSWLPLAVVGGLWVIALTMFESRERHVVGNGGLEYRRVVNGSITLLAVLIAIAFFFRIEVQRSLFLAAIPIGIMVLVLSRWAMRQWLRRQQRDAKFVHRAVVMAEAGNAEHVVDSIKRTHGSGFDVVGVVTSGKRSPDTIGGVPVIGGFANVIEVFDLVDADTLIIGGADEIDPRTMRRIGWEIADRDANLVVAPALTDVAGPRIHATPAAGLPFIHIEFPQLEGGKRFVKRTFDLIGSALILLVASPIMLATAIAIRLDSSGPVFYRQVRIGREGREFGMLKFRSMSQDADDQLASLLDLQGKSDQPLFKVVDDPRITRVGRFIRKHSIDEVPQLVNVLLGHMSLVGPRPQRADEVALYDEAAHRRLLVKPGMSGLWQVSGRSMLDWEDSLRLDLYYVENWSFVQDLHILLRTFRAVLAPGASAH
ncbi:MULTISPECIES: sugar transferase [Microbacterium]|uniref:sugar transferase n=1 Tax=Microbacterium TaxID=33882 RepID=UPI00345026E6